VTHLKKGINVACSSLVLLLLCVSPALAQVGNADACGRGYILGFFNGVWNLPTQAGAFSALSALEQLQGDTYNNEPVIGELFYNHTGGAVGATFLQDIAEVFIQRAQELDESGVLEQRFEFLWEVITDDDRSWWESLIDGVPAAAEALDALYTDIITKSVAGYALLLSNPPTQADYARHDARLLELVTQGQKLLLVAHSQGNLFVNHAYDFLAARAEADSFGVAHIAPASPTLRGDYKLADIDVVINGLRVQGLGSIPPNNLSLDFSFDDVTGHQLIKTYLDGSRPGRAAVAGLMSTVISSLVTPAGAAGIGLFTITLTWNGVGDVDLHTFEPNNQHVYYAAKVGASGFLDVDNVVANGPEHYFATCDSAKLQTGTYRIGINNYARATGRTATVQAASVQNGDLLTRTLGVGPERGSSGDASPIPVMTITVSKDAVTGEYSVRAD
jgi:hypothetical protein